MPKVKVNLETDLDKLCPDVYIRSTNIFYGADGKTYAKTYFQLQDKENKWLSNSSVMGELFVYIYANDNLVFKRELNYVKRKKNYLYGDVTYEVSSSDLTIKAHCGNTQFVGDTCLENIMKDGEILPSVDGNISYAYINKNKDLRLLDVSKYLNTLSLPSNKTKDINDAYGKKAFISYNKSKKSDIGYFIDIETFLLKYSSIYKFLNQTESLKNIILSNSKIIVEDTYFYKKNISTQFNEYQKINSQVYIKKINQNPSDQKYIITITDDNKNIFNFNKYKIKIKLTVADGALISIKQNFLDKIHNIKNFILQYKSNLDILKTNKNIDDVYVYYFEKEYSKQFIMPSGEKSAISQVVSHLSDIFSMTTGQDIEKFYSLYTSLFNPLTADTTSFGLLLESIELVEKYYSTIAPYGSNQNKASDNDNFLTSISAEYELTDILDYGFDADYALEVISTDDNTETYDTLGQGLKTITQEQKNSRKELEITKYLDSVVPDAVENVQYLSISKLFYDKNVLDLLNISNNLDLQTMKEAYTFISDHNAGYNNKKYINSLYQQVLQSSVYIKNIGHGKNTSKNKNFKDLLEDPNKDSKEQSEKIIFGTGLEDVFQFLPSYKYMKSSWLSTSYIQTANNNILYKNYIINTNNNPNYIIQYGKESTPIDNIPLIMVYNNFYKDTLELLVSGDVYELYSLRPYHVNSLFSDKLKVYNEYYLVEYTNDEIIEEIDKYPFESELINYDLESIYLNRETQKYEISNIISEI